VLKLALVLLALGGAAHAHGPLPEGVQSTGSPPSVVRTTHGILWGDGDWRWLCPEIFAPALSGDPVQLSSGRVLVATTQGVMGSDDGCGWSAGQGIDDHIAQIEQDGDVVWALTLGGLWRSDDDGRTWQDADPVQEGASLRSFVRGPTEWFVAGWSAADEAVIWVGEPSGSWAATQVPFEVAQLMEPLGIGPAGAAWFNFPIRGPGTVVRVDSTGTIDVVAEAIGDVAGLVIELGMPLLGTRNGLLRSDDGGDSWTLVDGAGLNWIGADADGWLGCHDALAGVGAVARWTDGEWVSLLELDDVVGPLECAVPADAIEACAEEWEAVQAAFLLGTTPPTSAPSTDSPIDEAAGCSVAGGGAGLGWLLLAGARRRRDQAPTG
jgi:hypothetical protein